MIAHDRAARSFLQCRADRSDRWIEVDRARGACRRRSEKCCRLVDRSSVDRSERVSRGVRVPRVKKRRASGSVSCERERGYG